MEYLSTILMTHLNNLQNGIELVSKLQSECEYPNHNQQSFISVLLSDLTNTVKCMKETIQTTNITTNTDINTIINSNLNPFNGSKYDKKLNNDVNTEYNSESDESDNNFKVKKRIASIRELPLPPTTKPNPNFDKSRQSKRLGIKRQSSYVLFSQKMVIPQSPNSAISGSQSQSPTDTIDSNDLNNTNLSVNEAILNKNRKYSHLWTSLPNGEKYQDECATTLDEAIYCLLLAEPDFRGAIGIANNTIELINLSRVSAGLHAIDEKIKKFDIDHYNSINNNNNINNNDKNDTNMNETKKNEEDTMTHDWFGKEIDSKSFGELQKLAFEAENYLKNARMELVKSELPDSKVMQMIAKAVSILQYVSRNQPNWE